MTHPTSFSLLIFGGEFLVILLRIIANPNYFCTCVFENFVAISKSASLCCASGGVVFGIEVDDNIFLPPKIFEAD